MSSPVTTLARAAEALALAMGAPASVSSEERATRALALLFVLELLERPDVGITARDRAVALDVLQGLTGQGDELAGAIVDAFTSPLPRIGGGPLAPGTPLPATPAPSAAAPIPPATLGSIFAPGELPTPDRAVSGEESIQIALRAMGGT